MKIATTTEDFLQFHDDDVQRVREISEAGFKYVDLSMFVMKPEYMQLGWEKKIEELKTTADKLGVKFVQAHSYASNFMSEDKEHVEFSIDAINRSFEICKMLGIKNTVVHGGRRTGANKEEWFDENKGALTKLFPMMERCEINLLVENSASMIFTDSYYANTGKDLREFVEFVNHPLVHACWDTGHGNLMGSQYDDIVALGEELYAIHYNDNRGVGDHHMMPFLGSLNHDEVICALKDINYQGCFTLECDSTLPPESGRKGRRPFEKSKKLAKAPLFMQQRLERLMYDTAKYILTEYGMYEE